MTDVKIPDIEKEVKKIKKNANFVTICIKEHSNIALVLILIPFFIIFAAIYPSWEIPYIHQRLTFVSTNTLEGDGYINETLFDLDKEGNDWEINKSYNFKLVIKPNTDFFGKIIVYLKPSTENGLQIPVVNLQDNSVTFKKGEFSTLEVEVNTSGSESGRYNPCVTIKDNKIQTGYVKDFCDTRQIKID